MSAFACDRCGRGLLTDAPVRYRVRIQVTCAYDPLELTADDLADATPEAMAGILAEIEGLSAEELEHGIHQELCFDLCATCRPQWVRNPLGQSAAGRGEVG